MAFYIGDQVKFLNSIEEGIIVKILSNELVIVDVDGFEQEVSTSEIVHTNHKPIHKKVLEQSKQNITSPGIYLALLDTGSHIDFAISNLQNQDLLVSILKPTNPMPYGVLASYLAPFEYKIFSRISLGELPEAASWIFHFTSFRPEMIENHKPWTFEFQLKTKHFQDSPSILPILEKKGWLISLQKQVSAEIKTAESEKIEEPKIKIPQAPDTVIDLHIEKLRKDYKKMQSHEILSYQLSIFEAKLEAAIQFQFTQITFIHGSGSGVLKACIQEIAKKHSQVNNTQPADQQRYGLGATIVFFK